MQTTRSNLYSNRIKELRERAGLRVRDLAQAVGVNDLQISKLEKGLTALTQGWLYRLSGPLQCQPWEILPEWLTVTTNYDALLDRQGRATQSEPVKAGEAIKLFEIEITVKLVKAASEDQAAIIATAYFRPERPTPPTRSGDPKIHDKTDS